MNELQIFKYNSNAVRTVLKDGEPWWVAKDICEILEIQNTTDALKRLDNDEVARLNLGGLSGEINIVSEAGLYTLILGSRKPEAKQFKRWITHEVIPSIRKTGAYMTPDTIEKVLTNPDTIIKIATQLKEAQEQIKNDKPKVLFADAVSAAKTTILIGDLAKLIKQNGVDIGANRLFKWLRENNYLISRKGNDYNSPTQKAMDLGLFQVKETTITHSDGHISISKTTKVTGYGQQYFINKFIKPKSA